MGKAAWPTVYVGSMKAMKRGRDKNKPDDVKYSQFVAEAQSTMPCKADIFERVRHESKTMAEYKAKTLVSTRAELHAGRCKSCKTILKQRRGEI
jgi:RNase P subunit RPR2